MKKIILGLIVLFAIIAAVMIWRTYKDASGNPVVVSSPTSGVSIAHTNEELCMSGDFTRLLDQEVTFNKEIIKDKFVQYLRSTLNNWLSGEYGTINKPKLSDKCEYGGLLRGVQCPDAVFTDASYGIPEIGEEYLKSKFIVLQTDPAPGGGESIVLMFKNKPDKIFYAWVYRYYDKDPLDPNDIHGFDLRALNEYGLTENEAPSIEETQKMFINQLCNQETGI